MDHDITMKVKDNIVISALMSSVNISCITCYETLREK